jgi:hypothetical protein
MIKKLTKLCCAIVTLLLIISCNSSAFDASYPKSEQDKRDERYGKLTGDGIVLFGGKKKNEDLGITVNSYLWRASLDSLSFMPLSTIDPFGGVILTDWYEDLQAKGERYKVTVIISSAYLRADAIKVTAFKQKFVSGKWQDIAVNSSFADAIEEKILTKARSLKLASHN